uniref:Phytanoyl-CoA hydroxylase-interacting protein-like C-terminal domain-containing protein n=1 Tax=Panagrolaimus sp. PS1159 TaxID=55785 RepID=A0AC35FP48_9BILA
MESFGNSHKKNYNRYSNLNLNQNQKCPIQLIPVQVSSKLKSDKDFAFIDEAKKNWKKNGLSDVRSSTLSLHIAAHENLTEATTFDLYDGLKRNKSDSKEQLFRDSFIQNPFEFPRQRKRNRNAKPEVMEFRANQRLFDPIPLNKVQLANDFASHFKMPNFIARPNLSPFQMHQQHLYGYQRDPNVVQLANDFASHFKMTNFIARPNLSPFQMHQHHLYGYQRDPNVERPAPYAKPSYYNEINSPIPYHRNPANRPDYWTPRALPPIVPLKTPHMELWKDFGAPSKPLEVILYARKSAKECSVRWQKPPLAPQHAQSHVIKIFENEKLLDTAEIDQNINEYSFKTQPGVFYTCEFRIKDARGINTAEGTIRFRATFSMDEMGELLQKAYDHVCANRPQMHPFRILYRCKPQCYWDDIQVRSENIMRKYIKDDNGQAANPTNGMIFGLFFSARLLPNGTLPPSSPFGNVRMTLPAEVLLDPERVNMYFSDFYCNRLTHYVTIVICIKGSRTDAFCMDKLVQITPNNPFVKIMHGPRGYEFYVNKTVWVEIYYTENVPLVWGKFDRVIATGLGTSRLGGLPHNKTCTVCNLYPIGKKGTITVDEGPYEEDQNEIFAQQHLEKMIASMKNSQLPRQECEDIVFLVSDLVDQIAYDNDVSFTVKKDGSIFGNESLPIETALNMINEEESVDEHSITKDIASKIQNLHESVTKRLDRVQSIIVKRKNLIKKIFSK